MVSCYAKRCRTTWEARKQAPPVLFSEPIVGRHIALRQDVNFAPLNGMRNFLIELKLKRSPLPVLSVSMGQLLYWHSLRLSPYWQSLSDTLPKKRKSCQTSTRVEWRLQDISWGHQAMGLCLLELERNFLGLFYLYFSIHSIYHQSSTYLCCNNTTSVI